MHSTITKGRSSHANFKWAWKDSELELFAFIASNKNGRKSKNNLEAMMEATRTQLLR
jgi:hypothetical protein